MIWNLTPADSLKFASGSYTGTGTNGSDNPCSVDVGFEPKLFFCVSERKLCTQSLRRTHLGNG